MGLIGAAALIVACSDADSSTASTSTGGAGAGGFTSSAAGPGPMAVSSATLSSSSGAGGANPDDPYGCLQGTTPPRPASIPEGWRPWACWSQNPACMVWIADDPETQAAPVEWEPCAAGSPAVQGCQQMTRPWPFDSYGAIGDTYPSIPRLDTFTSPAVLRLLRISVDSAGSDASYAEWVAAEPNGVVRYAIRKPFTPSANCAFQDYDLNEGMWIFAPKGDDTLPVSESPLDGAMLIDVHAKEVALIYRDERPASSTWRAGRERLTRRSGQDLHLHDLAVQDDVLLQSPSADALSAHSTTRIQILGQRVVWEVSSSSTLGIRAYDPERGPHDLIRDLEDPTHGAGTPGTDGIDLVWMEGRGRQPGDVTYPVRDVMTSPFTTDPAALEPRRLRSDPSTSFGLSETGYRVACGHAAKTGETPQDVRIVRLSDGHAWQILHTELTWQSSAIVGLTCDEVFLVVQFWEDGEPMGSTIQRIRLDALGEGIPPD